MYLKHFEHMLNIICLPYVVINMCKTYVGIFLVKRVFINKQEGDQYINVSTLLLPSLWPCCIPFKHFLSRLWMALNNKLSIALKHLSIYKYVSKGVIVRLPILSHRLFFFINFMQCVSQEIDIYRDNHQEVGEICLVNKRIQGRFIFTKDPMR